MKRTIFGLLILGLVHCAAYCWALRSEGVTSVGCFDQECYAQGARRIVEGHPFSYAPGLAPSTGQTSVLYPFVLAVPMALGAEGDSIRTASMALACLFYLVFLGCWGAVIARYLRPGVGRAAAIATFGLSGVCAYVTFTQCDQGIWMALCAAIAAALAYKREKTALALLMLAPWVRPEGMMLAASFAAIRLLVGPRRWSALLPPLSIAAVFALNFALTGDAQFASVAEKGYFRLYPFVTAAWVTAKDLFAMVSTYLFVIPSPISRLFSAHSPVTAVTFWIGLVALSRRFREWNDSALILAAATAVGAVSVASGGYSNVDCDRYLAWMMPLVFLISAYGLELLVSKIRSPFWRKLPMVVLIVTTLFSTVAMVLMMRRVSARRLEYFARFHEEARLLPADATVGSKDFIWAYELPPTIRFREISGVFTPELRGRAGRFASSWYEALKYEKDARFDYWVISPRAREIDSPRNRSVCRVSFGEPLVAGKGHRYLRCADWSTYDRAAESPLAPQVPSARLDVGYFPDERAARLRGLSLDIAEYHRFETVGTRLSDGRPMFDVCMPVCEGQRFVLPTKPGRAARLVMRTLGELWYLSENDVEEKADYGDRATVSVTVGGRELGVFEIPLQAKTFTDFVIDIPGECFDSSAAEFVVRGRFLSFAYWLYQ